MDQSPPPPAILAADAPLRARATGYPPPYAGRVAGRIKQPLGDIWGLRNVGVNRTTLRPGAVSALHHRHLRQDELVFVLAGHPTLVTDAGETPLAPGMVAGFPAGGTAHHLENRTDADCVILEVGDRTPGDAGEYPLDDLVAVQGPDGRWHYSHKDGSPW